MVCLGLAAVALSAAALAWPGAAVAVDARADVMRKMVAGRSLVSLGLPDPRCETGVISLQEPGGETPQVCCAGYCGECTDYPTCGSVRGQNSTFACCKTQVYEQRCGNAP